MGFAIGFVVLGLVMMVIGGAAMALFGFAIKITFSWIWFLITGVLIALITICKYVSFPFRLFKKKDRKYDTVSRC